MILRQFRPFPITEEQKELNENRTRSLYNWCEILFHGVWTIAFWLELSRVDRSLCSDFIWYTAQVAKFYYTIGLLIMGTIHLGWDHIVMRLSEEAEKTWTYYHYAIITTVRSLGLLVGFFMVICNNYRSDCAPLSHLIFFQFTVGCAPLLVAVLFATYAYVALRPSADIDDKERLKKSFYDTCKKIMPVVGEKLERKRKRRRRARSASP